MCQVQSNGLLPFRDSLTLWSYVMVIVIYLCQTRPTKRSGNVAPPKAARVDQDDLLTVLTVQTRPCSPSIAGPNFRDLPERYNPPSRGNRVRATKLTRNSLGRTQRTTGDRSGEERDIQTHAGEAQLRCH